MESPRVSRTAFGAAPRPRLWRDWRMLCETIGERRAGSPAERRAAEYIARRFATAGLGGIAIESFPCMSLRGARTDVLERRGRGWRRVEAVTLVGAPGTPGREPIEGKLAWIEAPEGFHRLEPGSLRGRIVALFGPLPTSAAAHRRLVAAGPAVVVHVDERLPFPWTKNDGVYPHWARSLGMPPTITVPYSDAWRWRRDGVARLRVRVHVDLIEGFSQNVSAEVRGRDPGLPALVVTAHHDTQCGNPGADDNASGVVAVLALAEAFARRRLRRTVRFISFGAEEQLSVGSTDYALRHAVAPDNVALAVNFDSVSSPLGHFILSVAGSPGLARFSAASLGRRGLDVVVQREITPFSDHFPFNRGGVPSLWFMRTNFPGGRWQHHSPHDTLANVSAAEVLRLLQAVEPFLLDLADRPVLPFPARLPPAQQREVRSVAANCWGAAPRARR
ncbi:MAG TPA: M28 family peptidase [Opitutaceae bacterium]|nr:M28 family peptidase [Opitutaceae bacterium]